jgi:hypothetical protein
MTVQKRKALNTSPARERAAKRIVVKVGEFHDCLLGVFSGTMLPDR